MTDHLTTQRQALVNHDSYATTLLAVAIDRYGMEFTLWHPYTLRTQLERDLGVTVPPLCLDRLLAAIAILTTDVFHNELPKFIQLCNVLAGNLLETEQFEPASAEECAWGITEAMLISPLEQSQRDGSRDKPDEEFSPDICGYIAEVLKDEGIVKPPDVLRIATQGTPADLSGYAGTLAESVTTAQKVKSDAITEMLRDNLSKLVHQLAELKLEHGDASKLLQHLPKSIT